MTKKINSGGLTRGLVPPRMFDCLYAQCPAATAIKQKKSIPAKEGNIVSIIVTDDIMKDVLSQRVKAIDIALQDLKRAARHFKTVLS